MDTPDELNGRLVDVTVVLEVVENTKSNRLKAF